MYRLYYHPICPFSRKIRVFLAAKEIGFELVQENFWERRKEFIAMNPSGTIPVLFDNSNGAIVYDSSVIVEYIEEKHDESDSMIGDVIAKRNEARKIQRWFDEKFYNEVSKYIVNERYFNRYLPDAQAPSSETLRIARSNLKIHLGYIEYLLETRRYLACERLTIADIAAATQISVLDYFGDVNWHNYPAVKEWYSIIKSHKIFNDILRDKLPHITPPTWYDKLDF